MKEGRSDQSVLLIHNLDPTWGSDDINAAANNVVLLETAMGEMGHPVTTVPILDRDLTARLENYEPHKYIVFNWCEDLPGMQHSDALVARTLEALNFTYTGSPPEILAFSWDKNGVKCLLNQCGIPTPRRSLYRSPRMNGWKCFPAIVKPAFEHCSFGISTESVVLDPAQLYERITFVLDVFHQPALVEDFIDGREFHVSIWGNGSIEMLPPAEMDFSAFHDIKDRLCTFDSKFLPGSRHFEQIQLVIPAPLDQWEYKTLMETCMKAYRAVGCRDYARLDLRLREGVFYVLDINPNPDISPDASMAYSAEIAGYSYGAMARQLVKLASQRHPPFMAQRS